MLCVVEWKIAFSVVCVELRSGLGVVPFLFWKTVLGVVCC